MVADIAMAIKKISTPPEKGQAVIPGAEEFQRESKLKDDKAKLDLAAKTPSGEFGVKGPLFQLRLVILQL